MDNEIERLLRSLTGGQLKFGGVVDSLSRFGAVELVMAMEESLLAQNWAALQALVVVAARCPNRIMTPTLCKILLQESENMTNEDVVDVLFELADPRALDPLRDVANSEMPGDELAHHFNRKCIQAIGRIATPEARRVLSTLAKTSPIADVQTEARAVLKSIGER